MLSWLYVWKDRGYARKEDLESEEGVSPDEAEQAPKVRFFNFVPRFLFRVRTKDHEEYATEPEDVARMRREDPDAEVEILPVH